MTCCEHNLQAVVDCGKLQAHSRNALIACRNNDFSKAGAFQISSSFLQETYAISDFKICNGESCLGFDSIQCQTCESDTSANADSEGSAYVSDDVSGQAHPPVRLFWEVGRSYTMHVSLAAIL